MPWCKPSGACRRFGAVNRRFRPPPARAARDLLLPKLIRGAIVVSRPPGIWGMSVDTHLTKAVNAANRDRK
jgi:hypothetical protein